MEPLIHTLATQHRAVEQMVMQIDAAIPDADQERIRGLLARLGTALHAHLKLEDSNLYPELQRLTQSSNQPALAAIGNSFSASMASISGVLTRFLERYQRPGWQLPPFAIEWKNISATLSTRIRTEETSLYPLYDKLARPKVK